MTRYSLQNCDYRDTARRLRLLPPGRRPALCLTSPPYDTADGHRLRDYGGDYDYRFEDAAECIHSTLRPGGILAWVEGFSFRSGRQNLDPFQHVCEFGKYGFEHLQTIIYYKTSGGEPIPRGPRRWPNSYELCGIFWRPASGARPVFNALYDRPNSSGGAWAGGRKRERDGTTSKLRGSGQEYGEFGLRHSVWPLPTGWQNTTRRLETWLHRKKFEFDERDLFGRGKIAHGAPALMPYRLAEGLILAYSAPGDIVWDPFAGACTTGSEALRSGRRFVGSDICSAYCRELGYPRLIASCSRGD